MAKFIPKEHIEALEYDFTEYGGTDGVIAEPTTGRVNAFFKNMKGLIKDVNALQKSVKDFDEDEMSDEELAERVAQMDEAEGAASEYQVRTIEYLAELCGATRDDDGNMVGGSPSMEDLSKLPYRVLQAFSAWLMGEIRPKKTTPGMNR